MLRTVPLVLALLFAAPAAADMITDAKSAISATMFDPGSAQWQDLRVARPGETTVVCGAVLAKNRFGGYTGWQQFAWEPIGGILTQKDMQDAGAGYLWPSFYGRCR